MSMAISGSGGAVMPQVVSGASMRMAPSQKMSALFQQIDTGNTGSITQQQFTQAFNSKTPPAGFKAMGAASVFSQLDPNGTGSVSKQDFISGMTSLMSKARHHLRASTASDSGAATPSQSLASSLQSLNALNGASSGTSSSGGASSTASPGTLFSALV